MGKAETLVAMSGVRDALDRQLEALDLLGEPLVATYLQMAVDVLGKRMMAIRALPDSLEARHARAET